MIKISKTIKRLRTEKGISQEALAGMLFISRQSVSSWENDRTQPDIEMLGKLSEIFDVSVEELIYGKKRNTSLETEKPNYNNTLIIVFSILGSLLAGSGIAIIFYTFWQEMPTFFKAILSYLPLLVGQGIGLFTLLKKRDKIPWSEAAGVLWTGGIAATAALVYNIFSLSISWYNIILFICISALPAMFLLKCSAPLIIYYGCAFARYFISLNYNESVKTLYITFLLVFFGLLFSSYQLRTEKRSFRSLYSHWLSIIAFSFFVVSTGVLVFGDASLLVVSAGALGLSYLILSVKYSDITLPLRIPGLLLMSIALISNAIIYPPARPDDKLCLIFTAICLLLPVLSVLPVRKISKDIFFTLYLCVCAFSLLLFAFGMYFENISDFFYDAPLFRIAVSLTANILLMISGAREKRLTSINCGFISVAAVTIILVAESELSMIANGLLLLIFGGILLFINFRISKQQKKKPVAPISQEVNKDE